MTHQPRKRFGQHFLHDQNTLRRICNAVNPKKTDYICEIGPGLGALTQYLLDSGAHIDVVEIDRDLITHLEETYEDNKLFKCHTGDALKFNFREIQPENKLRVCGNLPYNISTPLIFHLIGQRDCISDMTFLLQREVVDRITATANTPEYGRLSVMTQYYCKTQNMFRVSANAFSPPPKVESAVVTMFPYATPPYAANNERDFADIVREAFSHRRKTVGNACKRLIPTAKWDEIGIDPQRRPQTLSVEEFVAISNAIST